MLFSANCVIINIHSHIYIHYLCVCGHLYGRGDGPIDKYVFSIRFGFGFYNVRPEPLDSRLISPIGLFCLLPPSGRATLPSLSFYPAPFLSPFALSRSFPISHYDSLGRLTTIATRVSQVPQRKGKRKVETAPRGGNWQEREGERGIGCREARKRLLLIYGH